MNCCYQLLPVPAPGILFLFYKLPSGPMLLELRLLQGRRLRVQRLLPVLQTWLGAQRQQDRMLQAQGRGDPVGQSLGHRASGLLHCRHFDDSLHVLRVHQVQQHACDHGFRERAVLCKSLYSLPFFVLPFSLPFIFSPSLTSQDFFSSWQVLLSGILTCYLMSFVILAEPTIVTCTTLRIGLGLCLSICYSAIFTKTNRISRIFNRGIKSIKRPSYTSPRSQVFISLGR